MPHFSALHAAHRLASARLDARRERRPVVGPRDDVREVGEFVLRVNGYRFDLRLEPDQRDVRMWRVSRDGKPWMRCGLERVWRAVQAEMAQPLGRRHWDD